MRNVGIPLDGPRVSRWESGSQPIGHRHLTAYESAVGQPEGALVAANRMLCRVAGLPPPTDGVTGASVDDLDELFRLVEERQATGGHWLKLAAGLASYERIYLHPTTWTSVSDQLVDELTRSSGVAFLRRYEAAAALLANPQSRRHVTRSIGSFVMHPDAQNVAPALSLLREIADQAAGDLVLRLMSGDNSLLRRGAIGVAGVMAAQGTFGDDDASVLERHVGYELRKSGSLSRRTDAIELATQLPESGFHRVLSVIGDRDARRRVAETRATMELVDSGLARIVAEGVAAYSEAATTTRIANDPDQMLRRLVREGLFHVQRDRRHLAAVLLGLSPYAGAVAQSVLRLTGEADEQVASMSWSLLRRMGHVVDRDEVAEVACGEQRTGLRARGFVTTGLSRGQLGDASADQLLKAAQSPGPPSLQHAALVCPRHGRSPPPGRLQRGRAGGESPEGAVVAHDRALTARRRRARNPLTEGRATVSAPPPRVVRKASRTAASRGMIVTAVCPIRLGLAVRTDLPTPEQQHGVNASQVDP